MNHRDVPHNCRLIMVDLAIKLDDGWPESAEDQVTLVLLEVVHKRTVVNVLIVIQLMNRKEMR